MSGNMLQNSLPPIRVASTLSGLMDPAIPVENVNSPILCDRGQRSLGERSSRVNSPAPLGKKQVFESKQSSPVTLGTMRDAHRIRGMRATSTGSLPVAWWGGTCPPPDIIRKLWQVAIGYTFCVTVSLMLINWAMHQLPSPEQLALQVQQDPASMVLRIPRSFADLKAVYTTLDVYKGLYFGQLMLLYGLVFLFMQVFVVPGCFFVTILLGSLIPIAPAVVLVTALTTVGCVVNYEVSKYLLADVLLWMFPKRVKQFQDAVSDHKNHLFNYLLFLRSVPLLPSWLVNVGSPLAKVPLPTFVSATMIGFQPQYIILVSGGRALWSLHSWRDLYQWQAIAGIAACGILSLLPIFLKRAVGDYGRLPDTASNLPQ